VKALLEKMEIEDLPSASLKEVAKQIGVSKVKELMIKCGGMVLYIPKTFNKIYCRRYIAKHWDGSNVTQLAKDLGITERTVYRHLDSKI
jgi:Mor family transcriptional regulator